MIKKAIGFLCFLGLFGLIKPWPSAHAQTCKCASSDIEVFPAVGQVVPRNTQIWVRLPAVSARLTYGKYPDFQNYPTLWASSYVTQLLRLDLMHKGQIVNTPRFDLLSGQWRMLNLRPTKPLDAGQTYQIRLSVGVWSAIIGNFRTTNDIANVTPPKPILKNARYLWERQVAGFCLSPTPYAILELDKLPPNDTAPLLGVWVADPNGNINTSAPPNLILSSQQKKHFLGRPIQCSENNLPFPLQKTMKLGLRLGHVTGTWGPVEEITLAKGTFLHPWTWSPNGRVSFWVILAFLIFLLDLVRVWLFQRISNDKLENYLANNKSIEGDSAWIGLRRMVQSEKLYRLGSTLLGTLHLLLVAFGFYVFFRSLSHFAGTQTALAQLNLTFYPITSALFLHWLVTLAYILRIRSKRKKIAHLPIAAGFKKPSEELLKGWR